jgi:hypothetical protein
LAQRTSTYRNAALKATATLVSANPCDLHGWHIANLDSVDAWLHLYDAATTASVTVGTTTPKITLWVPAAAGIDSLSVSSAASQVGGVGFATGLVIAATTTLAGSAAPTNGELVNLVYV